MVYYGNGYYGNGILWQWNTMATEYYGILWSFERRENPKERTENVDARRGPPRSAPPSLAPPPQNVPKPPPRYA